MPRFALLIEYNGAPFSGWQRQKDCASVQQALEHAARALQPDCEAVTGAGRTDAGVHAFGQVAHVDLTRDWEEFRLNEALNHHLRPLPIAITRVVKVADDFHARFSAIERRYLYRVVARRAPMTLEKGLVWRVNRQLDLGAMQAGAAHLIGKHDFTTYRSSICQAASPIKTLDALEITELPRADGGLEYQFALRARSFLHNQVRSFVGSLVRVGNGGWDPARVKTALEACDRQECGPVAPARGLYLMQVRYPQDPFAAAGS